MHRRLLVHDERLVAKSDRPVIGLRRARGRLLGADEARRLFSATLRTRNRQVRSLSTDPAQLQRHGLPLWQTETEVAAALGLELRALRHFSLHSARERAPHYVTFAIAKRSGGERLIMAPKRRLKAVQRKLNELLVSRLPVSQHAHGFRASHSVRGNAEPHVGKAVVLRLDIRDFFASIHFGRVRGLLLALGYGYSVASVLAALMTEAPRQPVMVGERRYFPPVGARACPQGAPTSPGLSNALVVKLDHRLAGLARRFGFAYTRYADDLTFSGDDVASAHALHRFATRVLKEEGFALNSAKTRVMRRGRQQRVTGVTVNEVLGVSREERRRMRAALHQLRLAQQRGEETARAAAHLEGKLAYVQMLNAAQAQRLRAANAK
jgi:hypothetical protein